MTAAVSTKLAAARRSASPMAMSAPMGAVCCRAPTIGARVPAHEPDRGRAGHLRPRGPAGPPARSYSSPSGSSAADATAVASPAVQLTTLRRSPSMP